MDGGAGIVYECINGAPWMVSFGPLGPIAGMSDGWRSGSEEDSAAVFRTGAASRGVTWASRGVGAAGGEIRLTMVSFGPLGPIAGMPDGWRSGSEEDSAAVFRTGAASRGVTWASRGVGAAGGEIRLTNGFIPGTMLQKRLYVIQG